MLHLIKVFLEPVESLQDKAAAMLIHRKNALRPCSLEESFHVLSQHPERCLQARVVLTTKAEDDGQECVKARMTGRTGNDPYVFSLIKERRAESPTMSTIGKFACLQTIASLKAALHIGDIHGAFPRGRS